MFGNLYDDDDDGIEDYDLPFATATSGYKYRPDNCASQLEVPESMRDPREFAGLKNQGATWYMNSLFQTLYMIHDFRNAILKMPLCVDDPETPSGFLDGQKHLILFCLQKLFVQLKEGRSIAASTVEVTDSFGWKNNQQNVQHDVQEATRELLGVLDRALKGTAFETLVKDTFGGNKANIIEVPGHEGAGSYREEPFEDLMVQVKTLGDLETSLKNYFMFEGLDGDNQYFSEALDRKVDALKGVKIHKFPKILMISLQRFDLDYNTFQMVKLNEKFEFPLELNMNDYLTEDSPQKGESIEYELLSCIVHIGSVTGGHYKAYIRDYAKEGIWDLDLYNREEAKAEAKKEEEKRTKEQEDKEGEDKKEEEEEKTDFNGDFPIPYTNSDLGKDWYEFNDSFVSPILPGKLERQFGNGNSRESAYILVYKRKGEGETEIQDEIPSYWVNSIAEMNEKYAEGRKQYDFEKNHLEIFLQPQNLFDITMGDSLKYQNMEDTIEQGTKIKFTFDHTVGQVKEIIRKELSIGEGEDFEAFETCQLSNDLNQVFWAFSDLKDSDLIKDSKITHFSTWLITQDQEVTKFLTSIKGNEKEPIFVNLRNKEDDKRTCFYRDMLCSDFLEKLAETYGYESRKFVKATFFVDGVMRRLDRLLYDVEKEVDHTLKSLSVGNDAQIVIDLKTDEEIKAEEDNNSKLQTDFIDPESQTSTIQSENVMNVDQTENIRSVLLHKEEDPQFLERFNVDLNWTIEKLLSKLKQFVGVPDSEERRLRRELDNSLIVKEELTCPLKEYPEFQEGGVRLKLEYGRFPSVEELAITVALYGNLDFQQRFYILKESTVGEGKIKICEGFGVDPTNYKLWRVDLYDEPIYVWKKERQTWAKNMVSNGDLLILKSEDDILPEEQCIIDIHETTTGIPNDWKAVGHITMRDADTVESLKESILEMEELRDRTELDNFPVERIRLRMRSRNTFFGKIIRENSKSLKQLKIKSGIHLVVQFLPEAEKLKNNEMVILLRKRDLKARDYHEFIELKYEYSKMPTLNHLRCKVSEVTGISGETISIAKYIPHAYDWKYWDPEQEIEVKKKNKGKGKNKNKKKKKNKNKGKQHQKEDNKDEKEDKKEDQKEDKKEEKKEDKKEESNVELKKIVEFDLRTAPLLLSEGDILGIRDDTEEGALEDDFQTDADIQNRIRLEELRKMELLEKDKDKKSHYDDPFRIYTDF